jgi:YHS domain-containing protein
MKFVVLGLIAGMLVFSIAADSNKPAATQPATTQPVPVNKKCPISDEDVNVKGKTVIYKGKVVGFCCDDCIDIFNKNPDKYADKLK